MTQYAKTNDSMGNLFRVLEVFTLNHKYLHKVALHISHMSTQCILTTHVHTTTVFEYVCMLVCMYVCRCVCACVRVCVRACVCACVYACMPACLRAYVCMYICIVMRRLVPGRVNIGI